MNEQMTLGGFIESLERCDKTKDVVFDFGSFVPDGFISWRGSYDELCIEPTTNKNITVESLLSQSRKALEETFQGYKGGEYYMSKDTPLWVAEYSQTGNTGVQSVTEMPYLVVINTIYVEW